MHVLKPRLGRFRPNGSTQQSERRQHRILCVDDDSDLTRIIKARLFRMSVDVFRAASGKEGLKLAHSQRPDAVITDLGMSQGDGEFLLRKLKSKSSTTGIPVIVISGISDAKRISDIEAQGAAVVLKKPIQFDQLFAQLQRHLEIDHPATNQTAIATAPSMRRNGRALRFDSASGIPSPVLHRN